MEKSNLLTSLGVLFASFQGGKPIDPRLADEIVRPLTSLPDAVVERAIENFRNGLVPGMDMHFPPSIPEIVQEARRLLPRSDQYAIALIEAPPVSEEERKRVGKKMVKLADKLGKETEARNLERIAKRREVFKRANDWHSQRDPRPREDQQRALIEALDHKSAGA